MIWAWTCPNTWENGPQRLKIPRKVKFRKIEKSVLPSLIMKETKKDWVINFYR